MCICIYIYIYIYRVSQEERARLRESVPYVKVYRYNPKHLYPKLNGYRDYYYYWYSALGPVWAETRAQSGNWYGSGMLHPGQVLRGSLPLLLQR